MKKARFKKKKVLVAMSGGVDSSMSVAILKNDGYEVAGIFMRFWKDSSAEKEEKVIQEVKEIAKILEVPLKIIDVREKFKNLVVKYFLNEYKNGRTPNPCVICNEKLKFKIIFDEMKKVKADYVATGHYAQIKKQKKCKLLEAKDKNKDQSYFLYRLKQKQLAKIIFPLGNLEKTEVRKMAKKINLKVWEKNESQDVCFLDNLTVDEFLKSNLHLEKGKIINVSGKIIGEHSGLALYTIGQRKGINVGGNGPYYVTAKNKRKNALVVSNDQKDLFLFSKFANLKKVNWICEKPQLPMNILVRTRYRSQKVLAIIDKAHKNRKLEYRIEFETAQRAVAPGQSAVFYNKKSEVLGGGIIN